MLSAKLIDMKFQRPWFLEIEPSHIFPAVEDVQEFTESVVREGDVGEVRMWF